MVADQDLNAGKLIMVAESVMSLPRRPLLAPAKKRRRGDRFSLTDRPFMRQLSIVAGREELFCDVKNFLCAVRYG